MTSIFFASQKKNFAFLKTVSSKLFHQPSIRVIILAFLVCSCTEKSTERAPLVQTSPLPFMGGFALPLKNGWWVTPYHVGGESPVFANYVIESVFADPGTDLLFVKTTPPAPSGDFWEEDCKADQDFHKQKEPSALRLIKTNQSAFPVLSNVLWKLKGAVIPGESGSSILQNGKLCAMILGGQDDEFLLAIPFGVIDESFDKERERATR